MNASCRPRRNAYPLGTAALLAAAVFASATARADDERYARRAAPMPALYVQECGACHVPFPPEALPAASWQRLTDGLVNHFGSNAALDAASAAQIGHWLATHARQRGDLSPPPQDRLTRSAWFTSKHREIGAATWRLPAVQSPSNCSACHRQADQGRFDEHDIRLPR